MLLDPPRPRPLARVAHRSLWLFHRDDHHAHLQVRDDHGLIEVELRLVPDGLVLRLGSPRVEIDAGRSLVLRADDLVLDARRTLALTGEQGVRVEGRRVGVCATLGDVAIAANDDVRIDGERIWLNR